MTLDPTTIARLDAAATPGEWTVDSPANPSAGITYLIGADGAVLGTLAPADAALVVYLRNHLGEIRARLALPVIETCGACASCLRGLGLGGMCAADDAPERSVNPNAAPPAWCPLRSTDPQERR